VKTEGNTQKSRFVMCKYACIIVANAYRRHRCHSILPIAIDVTVPWSVCLSVCLSVMFVHCAQTAEDIDTISFAYVSPMSLPDRVKIWLTSVAPSPNFASK